jgi:hypothetical protein
VPRLEAVILKALAKAPRDRFQTAEELRSALIEVLDGILETELDPTQPVMHDETFRASVSEPIDPLVLFRISPASDAPATEELVAGSPRSWARLRRVPGQSLATVLLAAMLCVFTAAAASACYHWWTTAKITSGTWGLRASEMCPQRRA